MPAEQAQAVGVSIVTVALNAASVLPLTLESAIAQDYPDKEIILVDGASWDGTGAVLHRYAPALDRIVVAEDDGIYHAMNAALAHVTKNYVLFMNAGDQFFSADAISRMVAALEGDPDVFYGNHIYVNDGLELFKRAVPFELLTERLNEGRIDGAWLDRIPCHQATFTRTALLRRLRFDRRLRISADHDLLFRAHQSGARMQYIDEIVCHYFGGGFSAKAGNRTTLEGASVYRRHSDRPDLIDRFFFPSGSPFAPQTRRTGIKLGGFLPARSWTTRMDLSQDDDWVAAGGADLLAPARASRGLELSGYCDVDEQSVSFWLGHDKIGETMVPRDSFRLEVTFDEIVPPASTVRIVPGREQLIGNGRQVAVGFAVRSFRFADAQAGFQLGIVPGGRILFRSGAREDFLPLLGRGWSEPEVTHMWSLGGQSEIWLKLAVEAVRLRLVVSGNPHVPDGNQFLEARLNGQAGPQVAIDHGGRATLEIDCAHESWRRGAINRLALHPSTFAMPPAGSGDTRPLGFCLWQMDVD